MAKKRKKLSEKQKQINKAYQRQRDRIKAAVRRLESQGYMLNYSLPAIPKKKTEASIRALKKVTPSVIKKGGEFLDFSTGEVVPAERKTLIRRLQREQKEINSYFGGDAFNEQSFGGFDAINPPDVTSFTDGIIQDRKLDIFISDIRSTKNEKVIMLIEKWMNDYIHKMGKEYVVNILDRAMEDGIQLEVYEYESGDNVEQKVAEFILKILSYDEESSIQTMEDVADLFYDEYGW